MFDKKNLSLLYNESNQLIKKSKVGGKKNIERNDIEEVMAKYEENAGGEGKHQLMSEYMRTVFPDADSKDKEKQRKLEK